MSEFVRFREEPIDRLRRQGTWRFSSRGLKDPEDAIKKVLEQYKHNPFPLQYFPTEQMKSFQSGEPMLMSIKDEIALLSQMNVIGDNPTSFVQMTEFLDAVPSLWGEDQQEHIVEEILPELQQEQDIFLLETWDRERFNTYKSLVANDKKLKKIPHLLELRKRVDMLYYNDIADQASITNLQKQQNREIHTRAQKVISALSEITFLTPYEVEETLRNERNLGYLYLDSLVKGIPIFYDTVQEAKREAYLFKVGKTITANQMTDNEIDQWQRKAAISNFRYDAPSNTAVRNRREKLMSKGERA